MDVFPLKEKQTSVNPQFALVWTSSNLPTLSGTRQNVMQQTHVIAGHLQLFTFKLQHGAPNFIREVALNGMFTSFLLFCFVFYIALLK